MKRMKRILSMVFCVAMIFSITACSGQSSGEDGSDEKVVLTMMDWSDAPKTQRDAANAAWYEETGVEIEYTLTTSNQFSSTILTAVKSGQAPDIFPLPKGVTAQQAVDEGWFVCLEDYVDDPSEWDRFRDDSFANGQCMINGKIYFLPENPYGPSSCVFYNKDIFEECGLDPEKPPQTYSEFREYARIITEHGQGKYYGVVEAAKQSDRMDAIVVDWSGLLGSTHRRSGYPLNLATGTVDWTDDAVYTVFDLWQDLYNDGSIHPNTGSYSNPDARACFAQGQAGMLVNGWWNVGAWAQSNPELNYGVFAPPVPDGETYTGCIPLTYASAYVGINAQSEHIEEAVDYLLHCYAGEDYQSAAVSAGVHISFLKDINETCNTMDAAAEFYNINSTLGRMVPQAEIINPEASVALANYQEVHPNAYEIFAGVITGEITDYKTALETYSAAATESWEKAIAQANESGCNLSVDDFAFPDWDPSTNYS